MGSRGFARSLAAAALLAAGVWATPAAARDGRYLDDFEFIARAVRSDAAAIQSKKIDWKAACARMRPRFASCESDREHVMNVMELLACLRDSHTGVTRSSVPWSELPGKFDGLYGGGLWFGYDGGKFVLRGIMKGHEHESVLISGSVLIAIDGLPAWLAMARERARIARYHGISSDHSLFASLGNRLLPFGDAQRLPLRFLEPDGDLRDVEVSRWGPGDKAFYPSEVELPEGLSWGEGAVSGFIDVEGCDRVGYLRITGGMDQATAARFHAAMDALDSLSALILDCRSMGGGSDDAAWNMCGRFFARPADNGRHGRIEPAGDWQFEGPVVMLQDENMVSSAETFTWAMSETGRAVTVGRPTGGWGIIPRGYSCPSGLVGFRLGVNDRPTPIRGVRTEGVGWPPDVLVPFGPKWCEMPDPGRDVALEIVRVLSAGVDAQDAREAFGRLFDGDAGWFRKAAGAFEKKAPGWSAKAIAKRVFDDLEGEIAMEKAMLSLEPDEGFADLIGLERRLPRLLERAENAGLGKQAARLKKGLQAMKKERVAQEALLELVASRMDTDPQALDAWQEKHRRTRLAALVRDRFSR